MEPNDAGSQLTVATGVPSDAVNRPLIGVPSRNAPRSTVCSPPAGSDTSHRKTAARSPAATLKCQRPAGPAHGSRCGCGHGTVQVTPVAGAGAAAARGARWGCGDAAVRVPPGAVGGAAAASVTRRGDGGLDEPAGRR